MLASCAPRSQPARAALTQDTVLGAGEAELRGPWRCARTVTVSCAFWACCSLGSFLGKGARSSQ